MEIVDLILTRDDRTYTGDVKPKKKPDDAKPIMGGGYYWESHIQSVVSQKVETGGQARARQAIEKRMLEKLRNTI